jgi:Domain of unknown function (DUF1905)
VILDFVGDAIEWRGPSPFVFVRGPEDISAEIKAVSNLVTYGWGCIPVKARIGQTDYTTSLFPKDGHYLVPVKVAVQKSEGAKVGDQLHVRLVLSIEFP